MDEEATSVTDEQHHDTAETLQARRDAMRAQQQARARKDAEGEQVSGPGMPVDHERQPGVPPPANDDLDDCVDHESAESFPASDPPARW